MKIGWLEDNCEYMGGAELTAKALRDAAPKDVEIVDCPAGEIVEADAYIVHNCTTYSAETVETLAGKPIVKYQHDMWPHGSTTLRSWLLENAHVIFCSPLHFDKFPYPTLPVVGTIPPPCRMDAPDVERTKEALWLGHAMNVGKGIGQAVGWANETKTQLDFIGEGPLMPSEGEYVKVLAPVAYDDVPATLATYKKFVFLPTKIEPFGRAVAEAYGAGCDLVVNDLIGATYWLREAPERIETAAVDFWKAVETTCS